MSNKLFDDVALRRAIERFAASADGAVIAARLQHEKDSITRMLGASPQQMNTDWYRGRLGLLHELLDGFEGKHNGGQL